MKGVIRIGVAGGMGILIILGALYVSASLPTQANPAVETVAIQKTPSRTSVEVTDKNGNGIPDWEEALAKNTFEIIQNATTSTASEYTPPTTFTGKFSEAFMQDYLEGKIAGEDFSDPAAFIEGAITAIEGSVASTRYTRAGLNIIPSTNESLRTYGNEVTSVMTLHSKNTDPELIILQEALDTGNKDLLAELSIIESSYKAVIEDTLRISVPDILALDHVNLLNAYEAVRLDIEAMQLIFDDPLFALARIRLYENDVLLLMETLEKIGSMLDAQGITYSNNESGSFFYIFDAI